MGCFAGRGGSRGLCAAPLGYEVAPPQLKAVRRGYPQAVKCVGRAWDRQLPRARGCCCGSRSLLITLRPTPATMEADTPVDKGAATLPIRILHLSDIHFRPGRAWDSDPVLHHLARFVAGDASAGLAPDLVVLTGDLAFSGQADEYELARIWLERELWPALSTDSGRPLPRDRLLLVPGNHDVDRGAIGTVARMVQDGLIENQNQNEVAEVLGDAGHREVPIRRHAAYLSFYGSWLGGPQTVPWWQKRVDIRGQRVHVAGLDSAWMASGDADRGPLIIGRWQLNQTVDVLEAEGADWRLALLHHPWDYFAEFDLRESRRVTPLRTRGARSGAPAGVARSRPHRPASRRDSPAPAHSPASAPAQAARLARSPRPPCSAGATVRAR